MFLALGLCAQAAATAGSSPIRIGLLLPPEETEAESLQRGAELAVARANDGPRSVELIIRGRQGQWGDDGVEAGRMVLDDSVVGLVAPSGGMPTHLALQVAGRTATPVVSLCADGSVTGAGVPWSVRMVPSTTDEARTIMNGLGTAQTRWAALVPADRAGREITRDLSEAAAAAGCELNPVIVIEPTLTDFSMLVPRLPRPWPDGLLIWLEAEPAALSAKSLRAASFKGALAGPARLRSASFEALAGSALDGFVVGRPRPEPSALELVGRFQTDYAQRFGGTPDLAAAMAFDAVSLLIGLAREAGDDPMRTRFPITDAGVGVTGPLQFDRQGNRLLPLELIQSRNGKWTTLGAVTP